MRLQLLSLHHTTTALLLLQPLLGDFIILGTFDVEYSAYSYAQCCRC